MSSMDNQLRDLLETAVGEPPHQVDLTAVRRRVRRRRWADVAAVAGVLALVAGLGVAVGARLAGSGQAAAVAAPASSRQPAYYVQQMSLRTSYVTRVMSTRTGAVTATVSCPQHGAGITLRGIAAAGNGVFFVACQQWNVARPSLSTTRLYRFTVTARGRITFYSPVPGGALGRFTPSHMTATLNGAELAVVVGPPDNASAVSGVLVIDTRTGARGMWRASSGSPGMTVTGIGDVSLTADGRELAFMTRVKCAAHAPGCVAGDEVRAVSPAIQGGQLTSSQLIFRNSQLRGLSAGYVNDAFLDPSGSALTVLTYHSPARGTGTIESVVQVSATTGRQLRVLYRVDTQNGMSYQYCSMDPSGRFVMLGAGSSTQPVNGWIYHQRLIPLTPYDAHSIIYQAW